MLTIHPPLVHIHIVQELACVLNISMLCRKRVYKVKLENQNYSRIQGEIQEHARNLDANSKPIAMKLGNANQSREAQALNL